MKTLTINDLARTDDLDSKAMAAVHGGHGATAYAGYAAYVPTLPAYLPSNITLDTSVHAKQELNQSQYNPTGNGSAVLGGGISAMNAQFGQNNVFA